MKYAGVVVLYNPGDDLFDNINSYINFLDNLYIVDNTPGVDRTQDFSDYDKVKYIPLNDNKGIAYALNVGAKQAIKDKCDWLLTMDQDSCFEGNSLGEMIIFIEECKKSDVICDIVGSKYEQIGIVSPFHVTERTNDINPKGIDWPLVVMTSGNLVNLNAYKKVDGFKDWMFIDCVDFDFCLNLRRNHYEIVQLNYSRLNHKLGDTIKKKIFGKTIYVDNHSSFRRYFICRNRHYLYDMFANDFPLYCKLELKRTKREMLKIWLFEKNKIKKTFQIYRGYKDYKNGIKGGYNDRKK